MSIENEKNQDHEEHFSMKRFISVMGLIIFAILLLFYFRGEFVDIAHKQIAQINQTLANTTKAVNLNSENQKVLAQNQKVQFQNQRVIANGLNSLGSVLINDVTDIKNSTDLLKDIKFDVKSILNQSLEKIKSVPVVNLTNEDNATP